MLHKNNLLMLWQHFTSQKIMPSQKFITDTMTTRTGECKNASGGTKVDFRCRLSEHACNFPVCAVLSQRTLPREHTDSSQF